MAAWAARKRAPSCSTRSTCPCRRRRSSALRRSTASYAAGEGRSSAECRREGALVEDAAPLDRHGRSLGDLLPYAGQVGERLGDDQPVVGAEPLEARVLGMELPYRPDVG